MAPSFLPLTQVCTASMQHDVSQQVSWIHFSKISLCDSSETHEFQMHNLTAIHEKLFQQFKHY